MIFKDEAAILQAAATLAAAMLQARSATGGDASDPVAALIQVLSDMAEHGLIGPEHGTASAQDEEPGGYIGSAIDPASGLDTREF